MNVGGLNISIKVDGKDAKVNLNQFSKGIANSTQKIAKNLDSQVVKWGAVSLAMNNVIDLWRRGAQFLGSFIKESDGNEIALTKLNGVLAATEHAAGLTSDQLMDMSARLQEMTGTAGSLIVEGQSVLLTFKEIKEDAFERTMKIAFDLSELFGDLGSSIVQLGKALNDPVKGMSALSKSGVTFTAQEEKMIRACMEVNDILGAQEVMFKALEGQAGKVSKAVGETGAAAMKKFGADVDDVKSLVGDFMKEDLVPMTKKLRELIKILKQHPEIIKVVYNAIKLLAGALAVMKVTAGMKTLLLFFKTTLPVAIAAAKTAILSLTGVIAAVAVGLGAIIYYYEKMKDAQAEATSREQQNAERLKKIYEDGENARVALHGKTIKEIAEMDKGLDRLKQDILARVLEYQTIESESLKHRAKYKIEQLQKELKLVQEIIDKKTEAAEKEGAVQPKLDIVGKERMDEYAILLGEVEAKTEKTSKKSIDAWNRIGEAFEGNYNNMDATLQEFVTRAMSVMDTFSNRLATTLTDAMFGVQVSWQEVFKSLLYDFVRTMAQMMIKAIATAMAMQALNAMTGGMLFVTGGSAGQFFNAFFQPDSAFNPTGPVMSPSGAGSFNEGPGESVSDPGRSYTQPAVVNYNIYSPLSRPNWNTLDISRKAGTGRKEIA